MDSTCPHCGADLVGENRYCQKCTRRSVDFIVCEACCEPIGEKAKKCPYCSAEVKGELEKAAEALELEVRATHLGAFLAGGNFTGLFLPPSINIRAGRITVSKWSLLGLRQHTQEIQVSRVASVRYTKGVFWGGILVETFGGASEDLSETGLRQADAKTMTEQLKGCLRD